MKKNVAIVAGGDSSEFSISVSSAKQVANQLRRDKYNIYTILLKGKDWILKNNRFDNIPVNKDNFSCTLQGKLILFDIVFIAIHGTPGEDGKLQSYFDLIGIPYTSSGAFTSALTFNKYACKAYLKEFGISSARAILIRRGEPVNEKKLISQLGLPCFVKPNNSGSSVGVSKISGGEELKAAIKRALAEGDEVIIEEYIKGIEVSCGLVKTCNRELIFPLTEIVSKKDFFDYEAKYTKGMADEITPARIPDQTALHCQELSSKIYSVLNCRGIVRIDYILTGNKAYFLEINTVPGMSTESIIPKQAKTYGIELADLYELIIEDALFRKKK
jgi:D-alanine-D-alanine ligase